MICSVKTLSYYSFHCTGPCKEEVRKQADDRVIGLLKEGGVKMKRWKVPAEFLEQKDGPPIDLDDLLDMGLLFTAEAVTPLDLLGEQLYTLTRHRYGIY